MARLRKYEIHISIPEIAVVEARKRGFKVHQFQNFLLSGEIRWDSFITLGTTAVSAERAISTAVTAANKVGEWAQVLRLKVEAAPDDPAVCGESEMPAAIALAAPMYWETHIKAIGADTGSDSFRPGAVVQGIPLLLSQNAQLLGFVWTLRSHRIYLEHIAAVEEVCANRIYDGHGILSVHTEAVLLDSNRAHDAEWERREAPAPKPIPVRPVF